MFLSSCHKIFKLGFLHLILIFALGCKTSYIPLKSDFDHIKVQAGGDTIAPLVTERFLKPYRQRLLDSFSTVIANTSDILTKRRPGGSLGNLVCRSIEYHESLKYPFDLHPRLILMNYGGIRLKEIAAGDITIGKIFELLPFENTIVRMQISGNQLAQLLAEINKAGGWPIFWTQNHFNSIAKLRKIRKVSLITNNYIAQGGDNCTILKTLPQTDTRILLRDMVIDYLKKKKNISPENKDFTLK